MASISKQVGLVLSTFIPQRRTPDPRHAIPESDRNLSGKTVVFTGGTDGMGRVAVEMLYNMGARVILLGRNEAKGTAVAREIAAAEGRGIVEFQSCDLASMASVRACAERVLTDHSRIDVLVNCAGANVAERIVTEEGFETVWAINYLGPFLLTTLLLERLKSSAPARIVNLSSDTESLGHIDFDDLQMEHGFSTLKAYPQAKLALNAFTIDLARRLEGTGVTVNCLNPGFISSNLLRDMKGVQGLFRYVMRVFASPPEVGADRIVRLAVSSEYQGVTGTYVSEDVIAVPNPEAQDPAVREKLMQVSESAVSRFSLAS